MADENVDGYSSVTRDDVTGGYKDKHGNTYASASEAHLANYNDISPGASFDTTTFGQGQLTASQKEAAHAIADKLTSGARGFFEKVFADTDAFFEESERMLEMGKYDEALAKFIESVKHEKKYDKFRTRTNLMEKRCIYFGNLYCEKGFYQQTIDFFEKTKKFYFANSSWVMAKAYRGLNNEEKELSLLCRSCGDNGACGDFDQPFQKINDNGYVYNRLLEFGNKNNPDACYALGYSLENGTITKKDVNKALQWYEKAFEAGNMRGALRLGNLYAGVGYIIHANFIIADGYEDVYERIKIIPQNGKLACEWYEKAAVGGNAEAAFLLGKLYEEGKFTGKETIVEKNKKLAIKWNDQGAKGGYKAAKLRRFDRRMKNIGCMGMTRPMSFFPSLMLGLVFGGATLVLGVSILENWLGANLEPSTEVLTISITFLVIFMIIGFLVFRWKNYIFMLVFLGLGGLGVYRIANGSLDSKPKTETVTGTKTTATVTSNSLNLRAEPSKNSNSLAGLKKGDQLTVIGEDVDGWIKVEYKGKKGYVGTQYININK